eukprot:1218097-Pyramimonas_sp.AAC.1
MFYSILDTTVPYKTLVGTCGTEGPALMIYSFYSHRLRVRLVHLHEQVRLVHLREQVHALVEPQVPHEAEVRLPGGRDEARHPECARQPPELSAPCARLPVTAVELQSRSEAQRAQIGAFRR